MGAMRQGSDEWLEARRAGIGGSEAAALFGVHPWLSPYTLWAQKTGQLTEPDTGNEEAKFWGNVLEAPIRDAYAAKTGRIVRDGVTMATHPEAPCMVANTDGTVIREDGAVGVYEGKTTILFSATAKDWDDGVPLFYQVQVQHYLAVLASKGYEWASAAVFIQGRRTPLIWHDIDPDPDFQAVLIEREREWWERHVVGGAPPEVDGSRSTLSTLRSLHPREQRAKIVDLGESQAALWRRYQTIGKEISALKAKQNEAKARLIAAAGDAEFVRFADGSGYRLATSERKEHTVKASRSRTLRSATAKTIEKAQKARE